jgi:hypothetical protein
MSTATTAIVARPARKLNRSRRVLGAEAIVLLTRTLSPEMPDDRGGFPSKNYSSKLRMLP